MLFREKYRLKKKLWIIKISSPVVDGSRDMGPSVLFAYACALHDMGPSV